MQQSQVCRKIHQSPPPTAGETVLLPASRFADAQGHTTIVYAINALRSRKSRHDLWKSHALRQETMRPTLPPPKLVTQLIKRGLTVKFWKVLLSSRKLRKDCTAVLLPILRKYPDICIFDMAIYTPTSANRSWMATTTLR